MVDKEDIKKGIIVEINQIPEGIRLEIYLKKAEEARAKLD